MEYYYVNPGSQKLVYTGFVKDLREDKGCKFLYYPNEYAGEEIVKLCCTQHSDVDHENLLDHMSDYQRKKIINSWVGFLTTEQLPLKEVQLCTRTPQNIFDALCCQTSIESLRIKWLACKNLRAITKLKNLKKLFIEFATGIEDVSPIAELQNLEVLILGSTKKVIDYSALGCLDKVEVFSICSYQSRNDIMTMENDRFIAGMKSLKYLDLRDVRILNQTHLSAEAVSDLEYACFRKD